MDILLVASALDSLSQRVHAELSDRGHRVDAVPASHGADAALAAVRAARPDLVVAPMLRTALPEEVWREHTCLVVHPGPPGDRGRSSPDRAITEGATRWGVTVLRAEAGMDAGDVWAAESFPVPEVGRSDLYRGEAADAASAAVLPAVRRYADGSSKPRPQSDPGTAKAAARRADEERRPLAKYRRAQLARMHAVFFDPHAPYHALRSAFVRKLPHGSVRPLATGGVR